MNLVITGQLRSRINQVAHRSAAAHEASARRDLTAKVREAAEKGSDFVELLSILDEIESALCIKTNTSRNLGNIACKSSE